MVHHLLVEQGNHGSGKPLPEIFREGRLISLYMYGGCQFADVVGHTVPRGQVFEIFGERVIQGHIFRSQYVADIVDANRLHLFAHAAPQGVDEAVVHFGIFACMVTVGLCRFTFSGDDVVPEQCLCSEESLDFFHAGKVFIA